MANYINGYNGSIDWNNIHYAKPRVQGSGAKNITIMYFNKDAKNPKPDKLVVRSPDIMTWGINDYEKKSFDMNLQFPQQDFATPELIQFQDNMIAFESKIRADAVKNSKLWFGKVMSEEQIDVLWTPMMRYKKDANTGEPDITQPPTLRIKLPYYEGAMKAKIYDTNGKLLYDHENEEFADVDFQDIIGSRVNVRVLFTCGGVWFANGKFGVTWRLQQALTEVKSVVSDQCLLLDSNAKSTNPTESAVETVDTDDEAEANQPPPSDTTANDTMVTDTQPNEPISTGEIATEIEEEITKATPVTIPKKKKVTKKNSE